jgi:ComF family protein
LVSPPLCPRCGRPYPPGNSSHYCADCLEGKPFYHQARAVFLYRGVLADAVQRFKYGGDIHLAEPLGRFWDLSEWKGKRFDFLVPVPLHPSRLRERGFNQALLLGKVIAAKEGIKILSRTLRRVRRTRPQVELGLKERKENVWQAFAVRDPSPIRGKSILLVDDVLTTGATVNECAKVLKKAGAEEVWVWTLARAV